MIAVLFALRPWQTCSHSVDWLSCHCGWPQHSCSKTQTCARLQEVPPAPLEMRRLRGGDLQEVTLTAADGRSLRGALVYGFRHIQNLVRKLKRGQCPYDIVEVMACPSGCVNGGGQPKVDGGLQATQARIAAVEAAYHARPDVVLQWPADDAAAQELRQQLLLQEGAAACAAQFHAREKTVQSTLLDW